VYKTGKEEEENFLREGRNVHAFSEERGAGIRLNEDVGRHRALLGKKGKKV